ncbi:Peroxisomal fatty acid beta-oxidation multifunctional protein AIM1 [Linum perenne]
MTKPQVSMEVGNDGVAVIAIFNPPVNALAIPILDGLKLKFAEATRRNDVKAIVLTGKGGRFSGGFDINVFQKVHATGDISIMPDVSVDLVVNTIEDCKKPVVAAVEGLALGGGLELALGCHARIVAPRTQLGLPELTLGVIPGFGGTQRLPRLVGLSKAIDMMLVLQAARLRAKKISPNTPQHLGCLDVIEDGIIHGGYSGVLKEARVFKELVLSDTSRGLVHSFFAQRATSKVPGVTDCGLKPRQIKKVAVIGGGLMGSGIATALITSNIYVVLKEVNSEYLLKGIKTIEENIRNLETRGKLTNDKAKKALSMLKGVLDYSDFKDVDMVIEVCCQTTSSTQSLLRPIIKICIDLDHW